MQHVQHVDGRGAASNGLLWINIARLDVQWTDFKLGAHFLDRDYIELRRSIRCAVNANNQGEALTPVRGRLKYGPE